MARYGDCHRRGRLALPPRFVGLLIAPFVFTLFGRLSLSVLSDVRVRVLLYTVACSLSACLLACVLSCSFVLHRAVVLSFTIYPLQSALIAF